MGCRARAYAASGNYLEEEPFCIYEPQMQQAKATGNRCLPVTDVARDRAERNASVLTQPVSDGE
jgi:hypothetical protein